MVFQSYALFPHMKVFDNVAFGLRLRRPRQDEIPARVGEMLASSASTAAATAARAS